MRILPTSASLFRHWESLIFTEAALLADERSAVLAAPLTEHLDRFSEILGVDMTTRRARTQAYARSSIADAGIDGAIRTVQSAALYASGQDRKAPGFVALFKEHIGAVVRHALAKQIEVGQTLLDRLGLSVVAEEVRALGPTLEATLTKGRSVLEERRGALLGRAQARITIDEWKDESNALRLAVHAQLTELAAKQRLGRDWPEAFFPSASSGGHEAAPDEDAAPEAQPAEA